MKKKEILYFSTRNTTFVRRDIDILNKIYKVRNFYFFHKSKWFTPILFFLQLLFIIRYLPSAKLSFCMFAGYHSFLPALFSKIFRKKFSIILGGTDSVIIPELGYGILGKGVIGKFARWSYYLTPHFVPVHESLVSSENTYSDIVPKKQGILEHVPKLIAQFHVIYNGFDPDKFINKNHRRFENSFITVAYDLHKSHLFQLKGADMIIEVAGLFPECHFTIVGLKHLDDCPINVHLLEAVSQAELIKLYNQHEFYFQLSLTEGFPNALCEAMLCGCIPVVSDVAAMPDIVKGVGFVLQKRSAQLLKELMKNEVMRCNRKEMSQKARERISNSYSLEQRKKRFIEFIAAVNKSS